MRNELANPRRYSVDLLRAQLHETLLVLARDYAVAYDVAQHRGADGGPSGAAALGPGISCMRAARQVTPGTPTTSEPSREHSPIQEAEEIVANMQNRPEIRHGFSQA